jgi:hypothetical protein
MSMNSLLLTEKQQEVLWLRYGRKASIDQIAAWLKITRRAVLSRLRNARRRAREAGHAFLDRELSPPPQPRQFSVSQIAAPGATQVMDEL